MSEGPAAPAELSYLSFVDYAIGRTAAEIPSLDPVAMRVCMTLHRVTSALVYDWESRVHRPRGWSWGGFRLLFVTWLAAPLEAKRAAELSGMSRAAVSALANTLERDGMLRRTTATHDRRAVLLELTDAGHDAITDAFEAHNAIERAWTSALTKGERATLVELLDKLIHGKAAANANRRS